MIQRFNKFHCFKHHKKLDAIRSLFKSEKPNSAELYLAEHHLVFIYPNIVSFSFIGYRKKFFDNVLSNENIINEIPFFEYDETNFGRISHNDIESFFLLLRKYFTTTNFKPIFIFDIRKIKVLEEFLLTKAIESISQTENEDDEPIHILIFACNDLADEIESDICGEYCSKIYKFNDLIDEINNYINLNGNKITIKLENHLTLNTIEELLKKYDLDDKLSNKFLIELDFSSIHSIEFFAINLLNVLVYSLSKTYGVLWQIINVYNSKRLRALLTDFRFQSVNRFLVNIIGGENYKIDASNPRRFGTYVFNGDQLHKVVSYINSYIDDIYYMFPDLLGETTKIKFDLNYNRYRENVVSLPRFLHIKNCIIELLENIHEHSHSVGYISAELVNYQLKIFIGDSGIGLKSGINNNYDFKEINTACDALSYIYSLDEFSNRRIHDFEYSRGGGFGLKESLKTIFSLKGKVLFRTETCSAAFMNPPSSNKKPSNISACGMICGTQYMIIIPLTVNHAKLLPTTIQCLMEGKE